MYTNRHPLFNPDGTANAGSVIPPPPSAGGDEKISLPRSEYESLVQLKAKLPELETKAKKADELEGNFKTLFSKNVDQAERQKLVIQRMRAENYTDEEIRDYLGAEEEEPETRGNGRGENEELKQVKGELSTMGNALRQHALERAQETLQNGIETTLNGAVKLQQTLKDLAEVDAESKKIAEDLVPAIQAEARAQAIQMLTKKRQAGERLSNQEMAKVAREATAATVRKYELILGKASRIGKAPQMDDLAGLANSTPVPTPKFNPNATRDQVERENEAWALDYLTREAATLSADNGRV